MWSVPRIKTSGTVYTIQMYIGAGTSGRLGVLDASECPPTYNAAPGRIVGLIAGGEYALTNAVEGAEDDADQGVRDVRAIGLSNKACVAQRTITTGRRLGA